MDVAAGEGRAMDSPPRIRPKSLSDYLEVMSQTVFWVGISWRVVESKWSGIRDAFQEFDPVAVANLSPDDIDRFAPRAGWRRCRRVLSRSRDDLPQARFRGAAHDFDSVSSSLILGSP